MKKITFLILVMMALKGHSQKRVPKESSFTAGSSYLSPETYYRKYVTKGNQLIAFKYRDKKIVLQKFDLSELAFTGEKEYDYFTYFQKDAFTEGFQQIDNRYYFFYSVWDKENKIEQLFAYEMDFEKGEFTGQPKLLTQVQGKVTRPKNVKFEILVSPDKKAVLVKYLKIPQLSDDKKNFDVIGLASFTPDLTKIGVKEIKMPHTERRLVNLDYLIDNKANFYMLNKIFHDDSQEDKKSKSDTEANYHIELFTIKSGSDKIIVTKLDDKEKFINSLKIFNTEKSPGIIAGGYYSNGKGKNFQDNSDGVITFKMNEDGSVSEKNYYDIPMEVINQYESNKVKNKNERKEESGEGAKFTFLKLKNLAVLADGSIALVGEQYIEVSQNSTVGRGGSVTTVKYNDILVTKINPDGKLGWMRKIPKQQFGPVAKDMAFKFLHSQTDLFVVYLDNVKNLNLTPNQEPVRHLNGEGGYLTQVKMNVADGSFTKTSLFNTRDVEEFKLQRLPYDYTIDVADNSFVVEAPKSKTEEVLVKIKVK